MKTIGIIVLVLMICVSVGILPGGTVTVGSFVDLPSAIFVMGCSLGILLLSHSRHSWKLFSDFLLRRSGSFDQQERIALADFFQTGSRAAIASGLLGAVVGTVMVLVKVDDLAKIGPGLAVAVLTAFYGLMLSELVLQPMRKMVREEPASPLQRDQKGRVKSA